MTSWTTNPKHVIATGNMALCGEYIGMMGSIMCWDDRAAADCPRCQVLTALAEANGMHPARTKPSIRAALEQLLKDIG